MESQAIYFLPTGFLKGVDAKWHLTGSWRNWSELHFGKEIISIKINQKKLMKRYIVNTHISSARFLYTTNLLL
jgi:hypothetical protein